MEEESYIQQVNNTSQKWEPVHENLDRKIINILSQHRSRAENRDAEKIRGA
jgi:hypothetical protein